MTWSWLVFLYSFYALLSAAQTKPVFTLTAELRTSLEEHQSALELIMTKYREQVFRLLMASKRDDPAIVTQLKEQHTTVREANTCWLIFFFPLTFSFDCKLNQTCKLIVISIFVFPFIGNASTHRQDQWNGLCDEEGDRGGRGANM